MVRSRSSALITPSTVDCSQRAIAMLSEYIRQRDSVSSLFIYRTWPGPPGDDRMRQKVAFVVKVSLSLVLSRMTEFSPVRITRFASTVLMADGSGWVVDYRRAAILLTYCSGQSPSCCRPPRPPQRCACDKASAPGPPNPKRREDQQAEGNRAVRAGVTLLQFPAERQEQDESRPSCLSGQRQGRCGEHASGQHGVRAGMADHRADPANPWVDPVRVEQPRDTVDLLRRQRRPRVVVCRTLLAVLARQTL